MARPRAASVSIGRATVPGSTRFAWAGATLVLGLAAFHIATMRFLCDDSYISFRYAANLAAGHGLVYNPGEHVEGYTSFLWTVLAAAVIRLGGNPEFVMPVVSGALALLTLGLVMRWSWRRGGNPHYTGLLLAASTGFAVWGTGGLETALFAALVTGGCLAVTLPPNLAPSAASPAAVAGHVGDRTPVSLGQRRALLGAWLLGLASLTRPEGLLVTACVAVFMSVEALRRRLSWGVLMGSAGVWIACVAPHMLWRHDYYGHWLPQTFWIKTPGPELLGEGASYLGGAFIHLHLWLLAAPILAGMLTRRAIGLSRRDAALVAAVIGPYLGYVATTGGDFMPAFRFVAPLLPLLAMTAGACLEGAAGYFARPPSRVPAAAWAAAILVTYAGLSARSTWAERGIWMRGNESSVGGMRKNTEEWGRVGQFLKGAAPSDTLATSAAGIIPYRSGLYTIDLLGLNAPDLSRFERREVRHLPGHGLRMSGRWLHALRPKILLGDPLVRPTTKGLGFSLDIEPEWRDRILTDYQLVGLRLAGDPVSYVGCLFRKDMTGQGAEAH